MKVSKINKGMQAFEHFVGTVWVDVFLKDEDQQYNTQMYQVGFEPYARNDWHAHPGGQILICIEGVGYVQVKNEGSYRMEVGDVIEIPPNVWHGAGTKGTFIHIGVSPNSDARPCNWGNAVTRAEYQSALLEDDKE